MNSNSIDMELMQNNFELNYTFPYFFNFNFLAILPNMLNLNSGDLIVLKRLVIEYAIFYMDMDIDHEILEYILYHDFNFNKINNEIVMNQTYEESVQYQDIVSFVYYHIDIIKNTIMRDYPMLVTDYNCSVLQWSGDYTATIGIFTQIPFDEYN